MNLIKIENRIYNFSLLIEAEFTPALQGTDEETRVEFSRTAKLEMRFAAPTSEPHTDHNGDYTGSDDHSPYCRSLRGAEAEEAWAALNATPQRG